MLWGFYCVSLSLTVFRSCLPVLPLQLQRRSCSNRLSLQVASRLIVASCSTIRSFINLYCEHDLVDDVCLVRIVEGSTAASLISTTLVHALSSRCFNYKTIALSGALPSSSSLHLEQAATATKHFPEYFTSRIFDPPMHLPSPHAMIRIVSVCLSQLSHHAHRHLLHSQTLLHLIRLLHSGEYFSGDCCRGSGGCSRAQQQV